MTMRTRFRPPQVNKNRVHTTPTAKGPGKDAARILAARADAARDPKIAAAVIREKTARAVDDARHELAIAKLDLSEAEESKADADEIGQLAANVKTAQATYDAAKAALAALPAPASPPAPPAASPAPAGAST